MSQLQVKLLVKWRKATVRLTLATRADAMRAPNQ